MGLNVRIKERLVATGQRESYLRAREIARTWGGLPTTVMFDDSCNRSPLDRTKNGIVSIMREAWASQLIVHTVGGQRFTREHPLIDGLSGWRLAPECIPEEVIGKAITALVFIPEQILPETRGTYRSMVVRVQPENVAVVSPFIHLSGHGIKDPVTRLPRDAGGRAYESIAEEDRAYLFRARETAVRPLVINSNGGIFCDKTPDAQLEIVSIGRDLMDGDQPLRLDLSIPEILALAAGEDPEGLSGLKAEELAAAREVARAYVPK